MKIKNTQQLHALESAIDRCNHCVWLESAQGEFYDLKNEIDRYRGLGRLLSDSGEELELYTNAREDTAIMLDFFRQLIA
ncbi:MAG: hypothetical protein LIO56_01225 [Lachnospiraceae bacterium]|nr:hypothetical protein [Lachnospiraceae bacterium]